MEGEKEEERGEGGREQNRDRKHGWIEGAEEVRRLDACRPLVRV